MRYKYKRKEEEEGNGWPWVKEEEMDGRKKEKKGGGRRSHLFDIPSFFSHPFFSFFLHPRFSRSSFSFFIFSLSPPPFSARPQWRLGERKKKRASPARVRTQLRQ